MTTEGVRPQRERKRAQRARLDPGDMASEPMVTLAGSPEPVGSGPVTAALAGAAPAVLLVWSDDGRCTAIESAVRDVADAVPIADALLGDGWLELVDPDDRSRASALVQTVLDDSDTTSVEGGIRLTSSEGWAVLRVHRRESGGAGGVLIDATRSYGSTARLARLVENLNQLRREDDIIRAILSEGVALLGAHSATVHVLDDACSELVMMGSVGVPPEEFHEDYGRLAVDAPLPAVDAMRSGEPVVIRTLEERRERYPALDAVRVTWDPTSVVVPMYRATGEPFGVFGLGFSSVAVLDRLNDGFLMEVAGQCALALDRSRLASVAERNQEQLAFLDALSGALSRSLDVETALTHLAELTVPRLADWCAVRVVESAAIPQPAIGVAHRDPTKVALLTQLAERLPRDLVIQADVGEAFRAARPFVGNGSDPHLLAEQFGDPRIGDALGSVGAQDVVVFPLYARGRLIGALGFGNAVSRAMRPDEFELAHAVAVRAAVLVDNARMFAERSEVARALQDSLLPGVLPEVPGVELGARYRPAGHGLDVGGDFYDAFQADENWWVFAVGDVCGHGVEAASLTGLARHTIRSAAMSGVMPSAVLGHLNRMLLQHTTEEAARHDSDVPMTPRFCTVLVGAVQPTPNGVDIIVCSAGHPLPLVRRSTDKVVPVGVFGTLLGVTDDVRLTDTVVHLAPGESLVCYTDGLTDRRSGRRTFGEEGVVSAMLHSRTSSASEMAEQVEADAVGFVEFEPNDDMAVLVLKALPNR
jgi:serine phosphatase RsbU (regulator of sigma subunit)